MRIDVLIRNQVTSREPFRERHRQARRSLRREQIEAVGVVHVGALETLVVEDGRQAWIGDGVDHLVRHARAISELMGQDGTGRDARRQCRHVASARATPAAGSPLVSAQRPTERRRNTEAPPPQSLSFVRLTPPA